MVLVWIGLAVVLLFGLTALIGAPYVPSHRSVLAKAFDELRPLGADDLLVDIGSGDGVVLVMAARRKARAYGIEVNPILVGVSKIRTRAYSSLIQVRLGSFWQARFPSEVTVVYTFGESRDINKMYGKVQAESNRLNKPLDFISYGFSVAGKKPHRTMSGLHLYKVKPLQSSQA